MSECTSKTLPVPCPAFVEAIRSDELPQFAAALRRIEAVKEWSNRFQVDVILDANVVMRGMIWLAKNCVDDPATRVHMRVQRCWS